MIVGDCEQRGWRDGGKVILLEREAWFCDDEAAAKWPLSAEWSVGFVWIFEDIAS